MSRRTIAAVAALVSALSAAAPALADDSTVQQIAGSPLTSSSAAAGSPGLPLR